MNDNIIKEKTISNDLNNKKSRKMIILLIIIVLILLIISALGYLYKNGVIDLFSKSNGNKYISCISKTNDKYIRGDYYYEHIDYIYVYENDSVESTKKSVNGWKVTLTKKAKDKSTINSKMCSTVNELPIIVMEGLFSDSKAKKIDVTSFNTSNVVDMSYMFADSDVAELIGLNSFDTSKVTNMEGMFYNTNIDKIDVTSFNTSNVINMGGMFWKAKSSEISGYENFDVSNVTSMELMFSGTNIDKIDLSKYKTKKLTKMKAMFSESNATEINVSNLDTSKVANMAGLFAETNVNEIIGLGYFDTSNVENMQGMFFKSNVQKMMGYESFDTSNVTDMSNMFSYSNLENIYITYNTPKLKYFDLMFAFNRSKRIYTNNSRIINSTSKIYDIYFNGAADISGANQKNYGIKELSSKERDALILKINKNSWLYKENEKTEYQISIKNNVFTKCEKVMNKCLSSSIDNIYKVDNSNSYLIVSTVKSVSLAKDVYYSIGIFEVDITKLDSGILYVDKKEYKKDTN